MPTVTNDPRLREELQQFASTILSIAPLAADDNWFVNDFACVADTAGTSVTSMDTGDMVTAACPGYPVVPVAVVTPDTSSDDWTSVTVAITGIDQFGDAITDTITATGSSGARTATASHAFLSLATIDVTIEGTVDTADVTKVGFVKTIGLTRTISKSGDVTVKIFDSAVDAGTVSIPFATYVIAGTPDAIKRLILNVRPTYR